MKSLINSSERPIAKSWHIRSKEIVQECNSEVNALINLNKCKVSFHSIFLSDKITYKVQESQVNEFASVIVASEFQLSSAGTRSLCHNKFLTQNIRRREDEIFWLHTDSRHSQQTKPKNK